MAIYGSEILSNDIQTFLDETATEVLIPESELVDASFPNFNESDKNDIYGMDGSDLIPSNIPYAIDRLWSYSNKKSEQEIETTVKTGPVLKLKDKLNEDYILDNYNGLCLNLNTIGFTLKIGMNSTLVAL